MTIFEQKSQKHMMSTRQSYLLPRRLWLWSGEWESPCYRYAVQELKRLLERLGVQVGIRGFPTDQGGYFLGLAGESRIPPKSKSGGRGVRDDGYRLRVTENGIAIAACEAKGILNGVYRLAEDLGYLFLFPGVEGEWLPTGKTARPAARFGDIRANPRFSHRGVYYLPSVADYPLEEWLRFYAKLRFNAVHNHGSNICWPGVEKLGLRCEAGGHGLSSFVPRDQWAKKPQLFRMPQPEDFGGKRVNDYNFCVTNPETRRSIRAAYRARLREATGLYSLHFYADDLPGGGWCLCPSCRALPASDQNLLVMRYLAEAVREEGLSMRVPCVAYHDTLFPGANLRPPPECFLLFAPRERCYGHALDDPHCPRNRHYLRALAEWMDVFGPDSDPHALDYYCDQMLFRGMYPFLPSVILADLAAYQRAKIATMLLFQCLGPSLGPEYNMLAFAQGCWEEDLTSKVFIEKLARRISAESSHVWRGYLEKRREVFESAMQFCRHSNEIYADYRWLPETTDPFGREMASRYARAAASLRMATTDLRRARQGLGTERERQLARGEAGRADFEAAELVVMAHQQDGVAGLAMYHDRGDERSLRQGLAALGRARTACDTAFRQAKKAGLPEGSWYYRNINGWLRREMREKTAIFRKAQS